MASIDGGDSLSPEYAPWAYIGPDNEHFVWQTSKSAEHDGYLYRIGLTAEDSLVCERRPLEDVVLRSLMNRCRVESVDLEDIPLGIFPSLESMSERIGRIKGLVDQIDPTKSASDQLGAKLKDKSKNR